MYYLTIIYMYIYIIYIYIYIHTRRLKLTWRLTKTIAEMKINLRSIYTQQFRFLRAYQFSSDQMKILKDQSAQTTIYIVYIIYILYISYIYYKFIYIQHTYIYRYDIVWYIFLCFWITEYILVTKTSETSEWIVLAK